MCRVLLRTSHPEVSDVDLFLNSAINWSRCGLTSPLYNCALPLQVISGLWKDTLSCIYPSPRYMLPLDLASIEGPNLIQSLA